MSDKAYRLYKTVQFKAEHPGTDSSEAQKCKEQLNTIIERDSIPAENKTYRRKGESDREFNERIKNSQHNNTQKKKPIKEFSFSGFSRAYQEESAKMERQRERYREKIKEEQEYLAKLQYEQHLAERQRQIENAQSRQQVRNNWQTQSDAIHAQRREWPTGPRQKTNKHSASATPTEVNPVVIFILLLILYFLFF